MRFQIETFVFKFLRRSVDETKLQVKCNKKCSCEHQTRHYLRQIPSTLCKVAKARLFDR